MAGIYIHVPFCRSFCIYCDFYSELSVSGSSESFVTSLLDEFALRKGELGGVPVHTVYFGGGTPSLLSVEQLEKIAGSIVSEYGIPEEMTLEVNPEDIVEAGSEKLSALVEMGFNRISMGVQSFDDNILRWMRRRHGSKTVYDAFRLLSSSGFDNISIDLIFGYQSLTDIIWEDTLSRAVSLGPAHISAYQMTLESGSDLSELHSKGLYREMDDDSSARQYAMLQERMSRSGYCQYEVSNFAQPGMHSRHNSSYWYHVPYLGLGPGAHSFIIDDKGQYVRSWNAADLRRYSEGIRERGSEILTQDEIDEERLMLGLRCARGTSIEKEKALPLVKEGLLECIGNSVYRIPQRHLFISEYIISRLF